MVVLKQKHSVIAFDEAIYKIAKEIQWNKPTEFSNTIIRMGGFHILMNYMAALGAVVKSSGLTQVLVRGDIYSEVTVKQVLCGKHYNRGVQAHKIVYEAISIGRN